MAQKSFSLIELIMAILIIAILAIVASADMASFNTSVKLEGARWKLKSDLSYTQFLAVTQQVNHGVIFNPGAETYSVYRQNTATIVNNPLTAAPFTVNYSTDSSFRGVEIVSTDFGSPTTNQVEFNNLGIPSDGNDVLTSDGAVNLSYQGSSATVTVTQDTGKIE